MNRISFKGYAQQGNFDPLKLPDATAKIAQEGERTLRGMKAVRDQDRKNRDAYESVMSQKNRDEFSNRQANFDFDTEMRRNYREALNKNYETEIKTIRQQGDSQAEAFKALSTLSKSAGEFAQKYQEKKDAEDELAGMNAVYASGITFDEWSQLRNGEAEINATDATFNDLIENMKARGISPSQIDQLRNLSGKRAYGARKAYAQKGGEEYGMYLAQSGEKEVDINGQKISLARARANGDLKIIPQILGRLRTEYIQQYAGMDPAFANEYLFKGMRRSEQSFNLNIANEITKQTSAKLAAEDDARVKNDWTNSGAQGFYDNLTLNGGNKRNNRIRGLKSLTTMAQAGQFSADDLDALKTLPIQVPGSNKISTFGEVFGTDLIALQNAVDTKASQDRTRASQVEAEQKDAFEEYFLSNRPDAGYSEEELKDIESKYVDDFRESAPAWIQQMDSQEELADEDAREILEGKVVRGQPITMRELSSGRYSFDVVRDFKSYATKDAQSEATKYAIKGLHARVREIAGDSMNPQAGSMANRMSEIISRDLQQKINQRMAQGDVTLEEASRESIAGIEEDLRLGAEGKGRYAVNGEIGAGAGFKILSEVYSNDNRSIVQDFKNKVAENPQVVYEDVIFPEEQLEVLNKAYKNGTMPAWAWKSAELINMDPYELAESQLQLAGMLEKPTRPPEAEAYSYTAPEFQRLLKNRPSSSKTARAMGLTAQQSGDSPYAPILNLIASKESRSTDPENDGYDAMNTGGADQGRTAFGSGTGTEAFGQKLTQMSVAEVMRLQSKGALHASGRYQIIGSTLKALVNKGIVDQDELYSPEVQDRLAIELFHGRVGKFIDANGEEVAGLGQEWVGLQNLPRNVILQSLRNTAANLDNPNFNPDMMRNEIVYRVGNIGPTSTGAHLDVKQVGLDFFGRKTLDQYIGYKTAEGFQPLSTGVTVAGGEFGASRSYGEHRGWDYAMPKGTPVVLRKGAKIVAIQKDTGHGDRLTIGLPDGRQFEILHGKA